MTKGGRYIIRDGERVQVQAPTEPPEDHGIHDGHVICHANFLAMQAIEALQVLEDRLEQLAPGITDDHERVLPEPAGRWKFDGFPRVGLALLFRMMQSGSHDLVGAASEWSTHRATIQNVRQEYRERYPDEPLRLALVEHGYSRHRGFPPPSSCTDEIDVRFVEFTRELVKRYGEGAIEPNDGKRVRTATTTLPKHVEIASQFYDLHTQDPDRYPINDTGYAAAGEVLNVSGGTVRDALKAPNTLWQDAKLWGLVGHKKRKSSR